MSHAQKKFSSGLFALEMTMGMGFPMGMGIPWESHGNGTKIRSVMGILMGMGNNLRGNGNDPHSRGN